MTNGRLGQLFVDDFVSGGNGKEVGAAQSVEQGLAALTEGTADKTTKELMIIFRKFASILLV